MKRLAVVSALSLVLLIGCGGGKDRSPPPDLKSGDTARMNYAHGGNESLEVVEVKGNWVRMKGLGEDSKSVWWINFDNVVWYRIKD